MAQPGQDPYSRLVRYIREKRRDAKDELAMGRWSGEAGAREIVGRFKALDDVFSEIDKISPQYHDDGVDLQ